MVKFSNLINNKNLIPQNKINEKSAFTIKNFDKSIKLDLNPIDKIYIEPKDSRNKQYFEQEILTDDFDFNEIMQNYQFEFKTDDDQIKKTDDDYYQFKNKYNKDYEIFDEVQNLSESESNSLLKDYNFSNKITKKLYNLEAVIDMDYIEDVKDKNTNYQFIDEKISYTDVKIIDISTDSKKRPINSVKFLDNSIIASYGYGSDPKAYENTGIVCIYDLNIKYQAKAILEANSTITSLATDPDDSNSLYGGLYSGQLVKWDLRAKKTPVLSTKLTDLKYGDKFFLSPITAVEVTKYQNQNYLVSCGSDGRICQFNIKDFRFIISPDYVHDAVQHATAFAIPNTEMSSFAISSLFENIHIGEWKAKSNMRSSEPKVLGRNAGNVTCLDYVQPQSRNFDDDINYCMLSCASDGMVKLWNQNWSSSPLLTYEVCEDFLTNVKWLPMNSCMFMTADSQGSLYYYNLEYSLEDYQYMDTISDSNQIITDLCVHTGLGVNNFAVGDYVGNLYYCKSNKECDKNTDKFKQTIRILRDELNLLKDFSNN
eukprot:Mrub_02382.p1 GENE.Mrub_02382~~Mrub_02382.p1  ORF type:complete len:556 (+),score=158.12 Mrub_02382:49-1668(+)